MSLIKKCKLCSALNFVIDEE